MIFWPLVSLLVGFGMAVGWGRLIECRVAKHRRSTIAKVMLEVPVILVAGIVPLMVAGLWAGIRHSGGDSGMWPIFVFFDASLPSMLGALIGHIAWAAGDK